MLDTYSLNTATNCQNIAIVGHVASVYFVRQYFCQIIIIIITIIIIIVVVVNTTTTTTITTITTTTTSNDSQSVIRVVYRLNLQIRQ